MYWIFLTLGSKCGKYGQKVIYVTTWSMAFNGLIFVKHSLNICWHLYWNLSTFGKNVEGAGKISYMLFSKGWMSTEFHSYWSRIVECTGRNLFMPLSNICQGASFLETLAGQLVKKKTCVPKLMKIWLLIQGYGWIWSPYEVLFFNVITNIRKWAEMQWNQEQTVDGLCTSNEMVHIGL